MLILADDFTGAVDVASVLKKDNLIISNCNTECIEKYSILNLNFRFSKDYRFLDNFLDKVKIIKIDSTLRGNLLEFCGYLKEKGKKVAINVYTPNKRVIRDKILYVDEKYNVKDIRELSSEIYWDSLYDFFKIGVNIFEGFSLRVLKEFLNDENSILLASSYVIGKLLGYEENFTKFNFDISNYEKVLLINGSFSTENRKYLKKYFKVSNKPILDKNMEKVRIITTNLWTRDMEKSFLYRLNNYINTISIQDFDLVVVIGGETSSLITGKNCYRKKFSIDFGLCLLEGEFFDMIIKPGNYFAGDLFEWIEKHFL